MDRLHPLIGILIMLALAWAIGERRRVVAWRPVWAGLGLALALAALLRWLPGVGTVLARLNAALDALQAATAAGTAMVFGYLGGAPLPFQPSGTGSSFVLAAQALPLVLLERTLGIGGAAGMSAAANVFVGMVEAPVVVRPWLAGMSRGELFIVMNCGMATVAGTVLVLYASLLKPVLPDALGHLVAASVIAIPVAIAVAALMVPCERAADRSRLSLPREDDSTIGAIARGTSEGLQLLLNIIAMLVVFVAMVALVNAALGLLPAVAGAPLSAERILGVLFAPLAWLTGVPWAEAATAGQLLGKKTVLNEFLAFADLAALPADALSPRSRLLMTYALAGFANFGSLGIMVGGLSPMLPAQRRTEFGRLAMLSLPAGLLSTCITAAIVGIVF